MAGCLWPQISSFSPPSPQHFTERGLVLLASEKPFFPLCATAVLLHAEQKKGIATNCTLSLFPGKWMSVFCFLFSPFLLPYSGRKLVCDCGPAAALAGHVRRSQDKVLLLLCVSFFFSARPSSSSSFSPWLPTRKCPGEGGEWSGEGGKTLLRSLSPSFPFPLSPAPFIPLSTRPLAEGGGGGGKEGRPVTSDGGGAAR